MAARKKKTSRKRISILTSRRKRVTYDVITKSRGFANVRKQIDGQTVYISNSMPISRAERVVEAAYLLDSKER